MVWALEPERAAVEAAVRQVEAEATSWSAAAAALAAPGGLCEQLEVRLTEVLLQVMLTSN